MSQSSLTSDEIKILTDGDDLSVKPKRPYFHHHQVSTPRNSYKQAYKSTKSSDRTQSSNNNTEEFLDDSVLSDLMDKVERQCGSNQRIKKARKIFKNSDGCAVVPRQLELETTASDPPPFHQRLGFDLHPGMTSSSRSQSLATTLSIESTTSSNMLATPENVAFSPESDNPTPIRNPYLKRKTIPVAACTPQKISPCIDITTPIRNPYLKQRANHRTNSIENSKRIAARSRLLPINLKHEFDIEDSLDDSVLLELMEKVETQQKDFWELMPSLRLLSINLEHKFDIEDSLDDSVLLELMEKVETQQKDFWELMPSLISSRFPTAREEELQRFAGFIRHTLDPNLPLEDDIISNPHRPHKEIHAYMPGLGETKPFHDPDQLRLCRLLNENFETIREEYDALVNDMEEKGKDRFQSVTSMNYDAGWKTVVLFYHGHRIPDFPYHLCPVTTQILETVPIAGRIAGFNRQRPETGIPLHSDGSNMWLTCQMGVYVPEDKKASLRVGPETRHWSEGECLLYDTTYEHETINNHPSQERVVLHVDFFNTIVMTPVEIEILQYIYQLREEFMKAEGVAKVEAQVL